MQYDKTPDYNVQDDIIVGWKFVDESPWTEVNMDGS
jgi:hypothetical protein